MNLPYAAWTQCWQLTAVIAAAAVATACCRRRPHLAYALWMVVLAKALTPPILVSNFSALARVHQPAAPAWLIAAAEDEVASTDEIAKTNPSADATPTVESNPLALSLNDPWRRVERPVLPPWLTLWLAGGAVVASVAAVAVMRRNRLLAAGRPVDERLAALVDSLARQIGVATPQVVVSDANCGPAVCGAWRPTVILPASIADGARADLRPIITHELIHLRRGDHYVVALQFLVQAVWWFHPLVWWANRRICRVRELCCDAETVAALGAPPRSYARALVDVLDARLGVRPVFGFPGVRPVEVTAARIKEILAMSDSLLSRTPMSYWLAALVAAALVLPGGTLTPAQEPADQAADEDVAVDDEPSLEESPAADIVGEPSEEGESPQTDLDVELNPLADESPAQRGAVVFGEGELSPADPFADPSKAVKPVLLLKYGDGKPDGQKSLAGRGEMIRFTLPKGQQNDLKALRIHCARYGHPQPPKEDIEINILSGDMTEPLHTELVPYSLFKRQAKARWTIIPFEDAVEIPDTFWVVLNFNAEQTKGVYVSYDKSTKGKYSRVGFNDEDAEETQDKADWMVQAVLAK